MFSLTSGTLGGGVLEHPFPWVVSSCQSSLTVTVRARLSDTVPCGHRAAGSCGGVRHPVDNGAPRDEGTGGFREMVLSADDA